MTNADFDAIMTAVSVRQQEARVYVGEHGTAVAGTWSASDIPPFIQASTIEVTSGKTAAIIGDDGDTGLAKPRINMATIGVGIQFAPRGDERIVLLPTETSPIALCIHGADDTNPNLLPGEFIVAHRNTAPAVDASIHLTNDGNATNDGLGGIRVLLGAYGTFTTAGGHTITFDDTGKKITITSAGGLTLILDDNTGTIQHAGSGNAAANGIVRMSDLQSAITALAARVQGGSGVAPPTATASSKTFTA
jgi:hypothetical protein